MSVDFLKAVEKHGSVRAAARALNIPKSTAQDMYTKALQDRLRETKIKKAVKITKPRGDVKRFILSSAQDETIVHEPFLRNLEAYAEYIGAEILIAGFTYQKRLFEEHRKQYASYDESVKKYLTNSRYEIGNSISFCGEMNILPTAVTPLSGLETYTRERWGIFPHAKVQLKSIPTMKNKLTKMIMTTGTVTRPNYIQKKEGIKAHFHHVYGAVLVELCADGSFFCRHLLGDKDDGSFYDVTRLVKDGTVSEGHSALAVTWGDIHHEKGDETCFNASFFGEGNLLDTLKPAYQFIHDLIDFTGRNHHNIKDPHFLFEQHISGGENLTESFKKTGDFLERVTRPYCWTYVVESNHDLALMKWLKTSDYRNDPVNAILFLEAQLAVYKAMRDGKKNFSVFEDIIALYSPARQLTKFLREDDSFVIAKEFGGIECAMHGHLGANGAKASSRSYSKMGPKANVAHTHSAEIYDGIYTAGVSGSLDMGYNKGLSSWSHSHIVTYSNGKRAIFTMNNGKFFA